MRFLQTSAAALAMTGASMVRAAPIQAASSASVNVGNDTKSVSTRRRASLQGRGSASAAVLNSNNNVTQAEPRRRGSAQSGTTRIVVRRTPPAESAKAATTAETAIIAKAQSLSEADKAVIARKLKAGEPVNIGSIGVPCQCKNDNYIIQKRSDQSKAEQPRKKKSVWDDEYNATAIVCGILFGTMLFGFCTACFLNGHRSAKRHNARLNAANQDIEMANRERRGEEAPALQEPTPAHTAPTKSPTSQQSEQTSHTPYTGKWNRLWYGK